MKQKPLYNFTSFQFIFRSDQLKDVIKKESFLDVLHKFNKQTTLNGNRC